MIPQYFGYFVCSFSVDHEGKLQTPSLKEKQNKSALNRARQWIAY